MANLNKVLLIGRLTRDPEIRSFGNGGKVAAFGFAVNNRKRNNQTGQWEEEPVFLDIEAFNRDSGRQLADLVEQYLHKGNQVFLEGHLKLDQWTSQQDGQKRSKLKIVLDNLQFLEPRGEGGNAEGGGGRSSFRAAPTPAQAAPPPRASSSYSDEPPEPMDAPPPPDAPAEGENIPF